MSTREEKEEKFNWWITCIPDKIIALKEKLPEYTSDRLDYSIASLDVLERYLLENYTMDSMMQDKEMWDYCASYLAKTYKNIIPQSKYYIELDNKKNVFYNIPILRIKDIVDFEPHSFVTTLLDRKKGNFLSILIRKHISYIQENEQDV